MRQARQPLAQQRVDAVRCDLGAERLQPPALGAAQQPVVERLARDPALVQLALDVLVPVQTELGVVREVRAELEEQGTEVLVHEVEVVGVWHRRRGHQARRAVAAGRIGLLLRAQHARLLLRLADVQHALASRPCAQGALRPLVFARAPLERDQVALVATGEVLDGVGDVACYRHGADCGRWVPHWPS